MDFALNEDHLALREAVQRFCDGEYPAEQRGNPQTEAQRRQRWQAMADLGLLGLPFPAESGGSEQGPVELMLVAQEFGRALGGGAWLASTVMAGQLLARLGNAAQQQQWLPKLASGELQAALALQEPGTRYEWQQVSTRLSRSAAGHVLNGRKTLVLDGDSADLLLVVARSSGASDDRQGLSVLLVDARAPGVQVQGFDTLDGRRAAHVSFEQVQVADDCLLGEEGQAADAIEAVLDAANALLCAEAAGAVESLLAQSADYLKTRKQFGAPLAKFQVLQHRIADIAIALEQLKSMACAAAAVQGEEPARRRRVVSAAKAYASQQGRQIGLAAIQLHGGMGMTDECRIGHYTKRLLVIGQLLGDSAWHVQRVAAQGAA